MKIYEVVQEDEFGTSKPRPKRPGSRPTRGHAPVKRYNKEHHKPISNVVKVDSN